jgi:hypothetical protein
MARKNEKAGLLRRFAPRNDEIEIIAVTFRLSYPAHAGYPVRRGLSALSLTSLGYWIARRSLSSGAHSRDPLAGDDD